MKRTCLLAIAALACTALNNATAQTETSGASLYRLTPEKQTELKHTRLKVGFDMQHQTLHGEEWLTAAPYFYPTNRLTLDAKSMVIHEVSLEAGGVKTPLKYTYEDDVLDITLDRTYARGEVYTIYICYMAQPELVKDKGKREPCDTKGLYFIDPLDADPKMPTQIWTQGETEYASCWFPTIDKPNQKSTQETYITVPKHFVTLANGVQVSQTDNGDGTRTDYWSMTDRHAPYLFFLAAGEFAVVPDAAWRGKVPINYYVEPHYAPLAKRVFGDTPEMLEFYSRKFGYDFPWQQYNQIVLRGFVAGGMENTTAVAHDPAAMQSAEALADRNRWEVVVAHEAAHHWFGDLVTAESWSNLVVNEAFANYAEYLWLKHKYGVEQADEHLMIASGAHKINRGDYAFPAVNFCYKDKEDMFNSVSYNKAGAILHMLRHYLGDEAFFSAIGSFLKQHEFGTAEIHDLRLAFEHTSGKDLSWFFNQWFLSSGYPTLEVAHSYKADSRSLELTLRQTQGDSTLFQFPLEVDVYGTDGKATRRSVWVEARGEQTISIPCANKPTLVDINPRGIVLMQEVYPMSADEYLRQCRWSGDFKSRHEAIAYASQKQDKAILLAAAQDRNPSLRRKALSALSDKSGLSAKEWTVVERIAKGDKDNRARAAAIGTLATTKSKKYLGIYKQALAIESAALRTAAERAISLASPKGAKQ